MGNETRDCPNCGNDTFRESATKVGTKTRLTCRDCGAAFLVEWNEPGLMVPDPILSRFDHERHVCRPNPIECTACHGDGTGGLPA